MGEPGRLHEATRFQAFEERYAEKSVMTLRATPPDMVA